MKRISASYGTTSNNLIYMYLGKKGKRGQERKKYQRNNGK